MRVLSQFGNTMVILQNVEFVEACQSESSSSSSWNIMARTAGRVPVLLGTFKTRVRALEELKSLCNSNSDHYTISEDM